MSIELEIADWRRETFALYAAVRAEPSAERAWRRWRAGREVLFRSHVQSPIRGAKAGPAPDYFPYRPEWRFAVGLQPIDSKRFALDLAADGMLHLRAFARTLGLAAMLGRELTVYWLAAYGGGIFLPFADATSGRDTYGGGRYVLDTVKGADLGEQDGRLVVDFNFAYHPSCAYADRWVCPLAPIENRLAVPIPIGERLAPAGQQ